MVEQFLLNVSEAATLLRVQPNTIRVWLCKGQIIPQCIVVKLGRRVLFNKTLLQEWVKAGCKPEFTKTVESEVE